MIDADLVADGGDVPWAAFVVTEAGGPGRFPWYRLDVAMLRAAGFTVDGSSLSSASGRWVDIRIPAPWTLGPCWARSAAGWTATFAGAEPLVGEIAHVDCGPDGPVTPVGGRHDRSPWRFRLDGGRWREAASPWRGALVVEDDARRAGATPFDPTPASRAACW